MSPEYYRNMKYVAELEVTYMQERRLYKITRCKYQTMLTLEELEAIIRDAKTEHPWLADLIREWLQ